MKFTILVFISIFSVGFANAQSIDITNDSIVVTAANGAKKSFDKKTGMLEVERYLNELSKDSSNKQFFINPKKNNKHLDDANKLALLNEYINRNSKKSSSHQMPNTLTKQQYSGNRQLLGNNGIGFDVFKDALDGMTILKPDSSNMAQLFMPNKATKLPNVLLQQPNVQLKRLSSDENKPKK